MNRCGVAIAFVLLFCAFQGLFAQKAAKSLPKLNSEQKKHLKVYKEVNDSMLTGKFDSRENFRKIYELFSRSGGELSKSNESKASEMSIKSGEAYDSGKSPLGDKYKSAADLYKSMSELAASMPEIYKSGKKGRMEACIKEYLESETLLIRMGAKPCPRRWISPKEASACLIAMSSNRKARKK